MTDDQNAREEQQMSNENESKTDTAEVLKTPEEWCQIEGVQILDADGWRGRDGRGWNDPISLAEFKQRLVTCTQRSVATYPAAIQTLEEMQAEIRQVSVTNGWYDGTERPFGDDISLLHTEVSEMYEAYREWGMGDATQTATSKPEGVGSEAADVLIRLLDTCDRHGIDLRAEYERKLAHNRTRGYRHGGKLV